MTETSPFGPLQGLKVLELGQLIAGPFAGKFFADFGAEVIKVEPPADEKSAGGDPIRTWRVLHDGTSVWWHVQSRGKKSVTLNLRAAEDQALARKLALEADIVIENFRPGTLEKWGLGYDALAKENPRLIMLRISGFGQTGPMRDLAGFGSIAESMGGMRYVSGFPDRPPSRMNISIGDGIAALHGVIGILMALQHRNRTGEGQVVDVALYEAVFNMMESAITEHGYNGVVRERTGSGLTDNAGRVKRVDELDAGIGAWCAQHDADYLLRVLGEAQVPNGKIYSAQDIAEDPQYAARGMIETVTLEDGTTLKVPGVVPKLSKSPGRVPGRGPKLGEHNREILKR